MEPNLQNTQLFSLLWICYIWVSGGSQLYCVLSVERHTGHSVCWADVLGSAPKAASPPQLLSCSVHPADVSYHCTIYAADLLSFSALRLTNPRAHPSQQHLCLVERCRTPISAPFICWASCLWQQLCVRDQGTSCAVLYKGDCVHHHECSTCSHCCIWDFWLRPP